VEAKRAVIAARFYLLHDEIVSCARLRARWWPAAKRTIFRRS